MSAPSPLFPLPASVRAGLRGLQLRPRRGRGGRGIGLHASAQQGEGLEFSQYRAYEPGDDPRQIDWKLHARSDRFFVREAERESPLTVWILIDTSASMAQADRPSSANRANARCRRTGSGVVMPVLCKLGGTPMPKVPTTAHPASAGSSCFDS